MTLKMKYHKDTTDANFLANGSWYELYILMKNWKSDLEFYSDDLRFFHHLIDKYFRYLSTSENLKNIIELKNKLHHLYTKSKELLRKVGKHVIQLGCFVEDPSKGDAKMIHSEQERLENELAQFVTHFRENRKEVFVITEYIIDSEKLVTIMKT